ncbi:putative 2-hydroxyisoflavanone dehydratase, Carboxylesterase [Helianthus debilis subsp. tardiflorus]
MISQLKSQDPNPFLRYYKNGKLQRPIGTPFVPPSNDPETRVISKDIIISHDPKIAARLYRPTTTTTTKLPLLIYIHGGAFSIESAFSTLYHTHLNTLTAAARVIAVSIEYRLTPEHLIPSCYEDCWEAIKWVEQASDPWIKNHADLNRVFLAGDSAGGNIAHNIVVRRLTLPAWPGPGLKIVSMALVHPYFEFDEPSKLWMYICPGSSGVDDARINPAADPRLLEKIVCGKVQVCHVCGWGG